MLPQVLKEKCRSSRVFRKQVQGGQAFNFLNLKHTLWRLVQAPQNLEHSDGQTKTHTFPKIRRWQVHKNPKGGTAIASPLRYFYVTATSRRMYIKKNRKHRNYADLKKKILTYIPLNSQITKNKKIKILYICVPRRKNKTLTYAPCRVPKKRTALRL